MDTSVATTCPPEELPQEDALDAGDVSRPGRAGGIVTTRFTFGLFILMCGFDIVRPQEMSPDFPKIPVHAILIVLASVTSLGPHLRQLLGAELASQPMTICVLALLPTVLMSHLWHFNGYAARESGWEFFKLVLYYLVVIVNLSTAARLRQFLWWLGVFAAIVTTLSVLDYHGKVDLPGLAPYTETQEGVIDPATGKDFVLHRLQGVGTFGNPNDMARLIVIGMTIALYWIIDSRSAVQRVAWIAPLGIFGYALFLTASRGGFIALMAAGLVLCCTKLSKTKSLLLCAVGVPLLLAAYSGRITDISTSEGTGQERIQLWSHGIAYFMKFPIFGLGMAEFAEYMTLQPHNTFLQYYVELGFIGGTLFAAVFWIGIQELIRLRHSEELQDDPDMRGMRPYVLALIVGFAAGLLTSNRAYAAPTFALLGLAAAFVQTAVARLDWAPLCFNKKLAWRMVLYSGALVAIVDIYVHFAVRWSDR